MVLVNSAEYPVIPAFGDKVKSIQELKPNKSAQFIFLGMIAHNDKPVGFLAAEINNTNLVYIPARATVSYNLAPDKLNHKAFEYSTLILQLQRMLHGTISRMEESVIRLSDDCRSFQFITTKIAGKSNVGRVTDEAIHLVGYTRQKQRIVIQPDLTYVIMEEDAYKRFRAKRYLADQVVYKEDHIDRHTTCREYAGRQKQ